jgi:hypothetical protein
LTPSIDDGGKPQFFGKHLWQAAHHKKKNRFVHFFLLLMWRSLTVPVTAASQIVISRWQTAHH